MLYKIIIFFLKNKFKLLKNH